MRKMWICAALVAVGMALAAPGLWAQRPDMTPEPTAAAPSGLNPIIIVEFRNIEELIKKFEGQIGSLSPSYTPGDLWKAIASLSSAETLSGVDRTGRLAIAVYNPQAVEGGSPLGLGLTVSSSEELLGGLATSMTKGQVEGDLHVFHQEKTGFDFEAFKAATPEERKDVSKFKKTERVPVYVLLKGRLAIISQSREIVESMGGMQRTLERGLAVSDWVKDCDVLGKLDIQQAMAAIEPQIQQMMMLMSMAAAQGGGGGGPMGPQNAMQIVTAEIQAAKAIAKQVEDVSFGVKLDDGDVVFRESAKAIAGTAMANFLSKQKQYKPTFLDYGLGDSMYGFWAAVDDWSPLADALGSFIKQLSGGDQEGGSGFAKMLQNMPSQLAAQSGEGVISVRTGPEGGFGMLQVTALSDAAAGEKLIGETQAMLGAPFMSSMGLSFKKLEPETYEGVNVHRYEIQIDVGGEGVPPEAGEMIAKIYGESPMTCYAMVGNKMVTTFGAEAFEAAKRGIDAVKGGKPLGLQDTYKRVQKKVPPEGNCLVFISLGAWRNFLGSIAGPAAAMLPEFPDEVVYAYGAIAGDRMDVQLTLPAGFIKFIASQAN